MAITVTVLDTGGIQSFIFGSNVLRENVGASELVHWATRLWAFEVLEELKITHNVNLIAAQQDKIAELYTGKFVADGGDTEGAEVLYAGGGNTVILFQGQDPMTKAKAFVYQLSRRLLTDAPGLNLYATHEKYTWGESPSLPETIDRAMKALGRLKGRAAESRPALGWPITAACTSTGLPANERHPDTKGKTGSASRANRQVAAKWWAAFTPKQKPNQLDATKRLRALAGDVEGHGFEWTHDLDKLANLKGRDDSYIAVVHADGNGMGARIKKLGERWSQEPDKPREYVKDMRDLSNMVQQTAQAALEKTLNDLARYLRDNDWVEPRQHAYDKDSGTHYFPVRPVVFGGDDVTLVCAGPWGLAVAERYLAELERGAKLPGDGNDNIPYTCAGVAIVKTHYPFSQAYDVSEELIKSAKKLSKELAGKKASAIDWHLTTTGLHGDLESIRAREYTVPTGPLTMRPLMLRAEKTWRNWDNLDHLLTFFGNDGDWQERRNKILRLREALRRGRDGVAEFWAIFGEKGKSLPVLKKPVDGALKDGWVDSTGESGETRCAYFDPIEVADHFFTLPDAAPTPATQEV